MEENDCNEDLLGRLRNLVQQYREKHHYRTALFWADKVASLSKYSTQDVYSLAQCMFSAGEYERAALLIKRKKLHEKHSAFRYLAAKCYTQAKEWQDALDLLDDATVDQIAKKLWTDEDVVPGIPSQKEILSSIYLLKGIIYEARDTREFACQCYESALMTDVFCYEAFERLVSHHMLDPSKEQTLIESLPLSKQCKSDEEKELIQFLYGTKIKLYSKPFEFEVPQTFDELHENFEVASSLAERHYYSWEFRASYAITSGILHSDPLHTQCLPLHVALLVALSKSNELFYLAHRLVKQYPEHAISWYAVGCYYLLQPKKQELTRRYLLKATMIDKMYGPAWLALGHSFALEGEHDQAMAAYFTSTQLMRGSHLPYLYSGLEYTVTNNSNLAGKFFDVALQLCPEDPHTIHEIGVAHYAVEKYDVALKYFNAALELLKSNGGEVVSEEWEALLNNLGHTHRKLKQYDLALEYHQQALVVAPQCSQTYSSIGFVLSFLGRYSEALEYLHKALGLKREDVFASSLIENVIEQYAETEAPFFGADSYAADDLGPPPPFPQNFGSEKEKSDTCEEDDVIERSIHCEPNNQSLSSLESSSQVLPTPETGKLRPENETPAQGQETKQMPGTTGLLDEAVEGFHTPDDFILGRIPPPIMCGTKKTFVKPRRIKTTESAPVPLHFGSEGRERLSSAEESGVITPVMSSRKMLSLISSESSDDGGLMGSVAVDDSVSGGQDAPEGTWSTKVVKGGGFDSCPEPTEEFGDNGASVCDTSLPAEADSGAEEVPPIVKDASGSDDMEMDQTLDDD